MVQIKRKVTLRSKSGQESVDENSSHLDSQPSLGNNQQGKTILKKNDGIVKYLVGAFLVLTAILCGGYFLFFNQSDTSDNNIKTEVTENATNQQDSNTRVEKANLKNEESNEDFVGQTEELNASNSKSNNDKVNKPAELNEKQTDSSADKESSHAVQSSMDNNSNKQYSSQASLPISLLEQKAKEVIRGNYGNGIERKQKLGDQYVEIQDKVNEMYKNGLVD